MNNVSQIRASELARWYMGTEGGFLNHLAREEILMMVGTLAVRYKKPIKPFQKYIVESQIIGWDDKWMFVSQQFKNEQGRLHTQVGPSTLPF
jgi:acyl-CoA thioesterase FadM